MKYHILYVFIYILSISFVKAQDIPTKRLKFESYTINDGLSQGMINCIIQDRYGFMWFATKDGLDRYDGNNFTIFRHNASDKTSIADNYIQWIFEDAKGRLWVGTSSEGVDLFDRETETFHHFRHNEKNSNSIPNNHIIQITEDKLGNIWITTSNGLSRLSINDNTRNDNDRYHFKLIDPSSGAYVFIAHNNDVYIYKNHHVYVSAGKNLDFKKIPDDKIFATSDKDTVFLNYLSVMFEDTIQHKIYFVTTNAITRLDEQNNTYTLLRKKADRYLMLFRPECSLVDNRMWLCISGWLEIFDINAKTLHHIQSDDPNLDHILYYVNCTYQDRSGNIWVGTKGYGILMYNPRREYFHHIDNTSIQFMSEKNDGKVYVSRQNFYSQIIYLFDKSTMQFTIPSPDSMAQLHIEEGGIIESLVQQNNYIWLFKRYIIKYDTITKTCVEYKNNTNNYIFPIYKDHENRIWCNNSRALCRYDENKNTFMEYPYPIPVVNVPYNFVEIIYEDNNGIFWLGTMSGLLRFDPVKQSWKQYKNDPNDTTSLSFNIVFSICSDPLSPDKYLWVGTNGGGLNKLDTRTGKFARYSAESSGLPNNVVYGILSDDYGNIWMSTNKGLSKLNLGINKFKNYDVKDGLQSNEFNRYEYCKTHDGYLFFGGVNGFNFFNPKELTDNSAIPNILITDFKIKNIPVSFKSKNAPLKKPIYLTRNITLDYSQNMISFEFASMDFTVVAKNMFKYKLEGFDKNWITADNNHIATYTNLDPGEYTFTVKGTNNDGTWNEKGASVTLLILPPWYMTWWFRVSLILVISCIVYGTYRYRLNQALRLQNIRNYIASDLHDEIGSTLSSVSLFNEVIKKKILIKAPEVIPMVTRVSENIDNMMEAMNDIVWTINSRNDSFENIVSRMSEAAAELFEAKGYELHFKFDEELSRVRLGMQERKNFYLIFKEAINNIAKYADGKTVWIDVTIEHKVIYMRVKDDGKGFDIKKASNGNGMLTMQKRAEELKGSLKIDSLIDAGTSIELTFPIT